MNRLLLTRSQLGRVTFLVQTRSFSKQYSKKLPDHVVPLKCPSSANSGFCKIYLIGTCHISKKSCEEVRAIIDIVRPEIVFLELCKSRQNVLKAKQQIPTMNEMLTAAWKKRSNINIFGLLISLIYAFIARELKVIPGSEFRVAYEEAIKYGGKVVLGDRPIQITLKRAWRKMPLREKTRFFTCLFGKKSPRLTEVISTEVMWNLLKGIECDIDMDMIKRIEQEVGEIFPTFIETILHERDLYMTYTLSQVAKKSSSVVAVVGRGHLPGIKKHWKQPILVEDLLKIPPPPKPAMSTIILTSVGVAVAGVSIIWGYLHS